MPANTASVMFLNDPFRRSGSTDPTVVNSRDRERLPIQVATPFAYGGITESWVAPGAVGAVHNPSWGQVDLRVHYVKNIQKMTTEFFVDLFNVFDDQAATRTEDLVAGTGGTAFGDDIA